METRMGPAELAAPQQGARLGAQKKQHYPPKPRELWAPSNITQGETTTPLPPQRRHPPTPRAVRVSADSRRIACQAPC